MTPDEHVAIVGGGLSGTLLAINLLRHDGPRATLLERAPAQVARGVAYSAAQDEHLLNVRADNMSALPDEPHHFVAWLERAGLGTRTTFVPRRVYGRYLREMLAETAAVAGDRLRVVRGDVTRVDPLADGCTLTLGDGRRTTADRVVLALGNLPPIAPAGIAPDTLPAGCYCADPWAGDIADGLRGDETVLLLGSGLTAVDAALLLGAAGFGGRIRMLSRRGLLPQRHTDAPPAAGLRERPAGTLADLVAQTRTRAAELGWRAAVDELRPVTQLLWGAADEATRRRFLRHLRPYWDIHRHRLAPPVADAIDALRAARLDVAAGKLVETVPQGSGALVRWRPRGSDAIVATIAARIVNCTGPQGDLTRTPEPLLRHLLQAGAIRADALRIGVDVDAQSRVIRRDGRVDERLFCIGPMTRGAFWEVVAVPDIRRQNWSLARQLAHAEWVGGEEL